MTDLLNSEIREQVREVFADLKEPVEVLFFGRSEDCLYCEDAQNLAGEVVGLSDKLSLRAYDLDDDADIAAEYNVDKAPTLVLVAKNGADSKDYGIRYAGIPSGHEFSSFIHDLLRVSSRDSGLKPATRDFLSKLSEPVHLQVFVTPTCPYCPRAVLLAHQMAMESDLVQAEMVESSEFMELASQFGVSGVPNTLINHGAGRVVGAVPEEHLLAEIQRVVAS